MVFLVYDKYKKLKLTKVENMELQSLSDELLIYTYLKATEIQLDHSFTSLLYNEIEHRNILDLLESITEEELCRR